MLNGLTAWLLLAWGILVPGVSIGLLIWINIHMRRNHKSPPPSVETKPDLDKASKGKKVVWFHKARGIAWAAFGLLSFAMGWQNNVALVWAASVYANALTDWGAGEAADNTKVLDGMQELKKQNEEILRLLKERE